MSDPNFVADKKLVTAENIIPYRFTDRLKLRQGLQLADSVRGQNGSSLLALATRYGHTSTVKYLLEQGADVNSSDNLERTALMESALWGNAEIVDLLLQQGAERHRKENNGLRAYDFAVESECNDKERSERHNKYREDPFVMKDQRMLIRKLLDEETSKRSTNTTHPCWKTSRIRTSTNLQMLVP